MTLLDRVQKKAGEDPADVGAATPRQPAAPEAPQHPEPAPAAPEGSADSAAPPRQTALINRVGGLSRGGLARSDSPASQSALRDRVHARLVEELSSSGTPTHDEVVSRLTELVNEVVVEQNLTMSRQDRMRVVEMVTNAVLGLGPLEALLNDVTITEIMINGPKQIFIEQKGKITLSSVSFENNEQLMQIIDRIVSTIGRRVDESSPMVDARLKDGSRVNVIIPPLALSGPTVTIRKFAKEALTVNDLVKYGSMTADMITFVRACVASRLNVVVSGGTGSGKTTLLNLLSGFIPDDERIITIEDAAELQLRQEHVVTLETRPANVEGRGKVAIRDLVINSLRMRPDRIVVGECRGGEALDMLQAMNTGHDGSMTTVHANNPKDTLSRLETMVLMAGAELPSRAIRDQIASAINVIVQTARLRDGSRKVISISELTGYEGEQFKMQEIFAFHQTGVNEEGKVQGTLGPTGVIPACLDLLQTSGFAVSHALFEPADAGGPDVAPALEPVVAAKAV